MRGRVVTLHGAQLSCDAAGLTWSDEAERSAVNFAN